MTSVNNQLQELGVLRQLEHDPQSNWTRGGEPGWLYPPQARVIPVELQDGSTQYAVIDETGWDGYRPVPNEVVGLFPTSAAAWDAANQIVN